MAMYSPYSQGAGGHLAPNCWSGPRSRRPWRATFAIFRPADPSAAIEVKPVRRALGFALFPSRIGAWLLGSAALLGLALAAVDYGVLAYSVVRRTPEIGLRMALGASGWTIVLMVLRRERGSGGIGRRGGVGHRRICDAASGNLPEVSELHPTDPPTILGVIGVLTAVAVAATLAPAVRAIRIDPMTALRSE